MVLDYAANMGGIFVIVLNNFQDELTSEYNFQILDSLDPQASSTTNEIIGKSFDYG